MEQRFTFNKVAELYDQARAGYPQALYDDLMEFANLSAGDAILEVGCGTGKATEEFARRGLRVVALDPGPDMIAAARRRLARSESASVSSRRRSRPGRSNPAPSGSSPRPSRGTGSPRTYASIKPSRRLRPAERSRFSEPAPEPVPQPLRGSFGESLLASCAGAWRTAAGTRLSAERPLSRRFRPLRPVRAGDPQILSLVPFVFGPKLCRISRHGFPLSVDG